MATRICSNQETVKKCIQGDFSDLGERNRAKRELKKLQNKKIRKITHRECKKYVGDKNFVRTNNPVCERSGHGNFSVKKGEEIGCIVPFDVPRHFNFKKKF